MSNDVQEAYDGSDADKTRALYLRLIEHGPIGDIAVNLLRASKASARAKVYQGRPARGQPTYRRQAYDKKSWAVSELAKSLDILGAELGIRWGWGKDRNVGQGFDDVIYIDLPGAGQVSFHSPHRGFGPDYPGAWDGARGEGARRIIRFATAVLDTGMPPQPEEQAHEPRQDGGQGETGPALEIRPARPEGGENQQAFDF